jgi:hypothetical protein
LCVIAAKLPTNVVKFATDVDKLPNFDVAKLRQHPSCIVLVAALPIFGDAEDTK